MNFEKNPVEKGIMTVGDLKPFCCVRFVQSGEMCMLVDELAGLSPKGSVRFISLETGKTMLKSRYDKVNLIKLCIRGNKFVTFGELNVGDCFCFLTAPFFDYMKVDCGECGKGCVDLKTGQFSAPDASERVVLCKEPVAWEFCVGESV